MAPAPAPAPSNRQPRPTRGMRISIPSPQESHSFDFGFPSTPTTLQKNLMRFAFLPGAASAVGGNGRRRGWHTEYGRPDLPYMLRDLRRDFGRRTCVFVCGPEGMRVDVQRCVARMQGGVLRGEVDEIYMHTENYAL